MSLKGGDRLSVGQPVQLTFALPLGCVVTVDAVVAWQKSNLTGLRFDPRFEYPAIPTCA